MIIRTDKKQTRFSVIDNTGLNDPRLSYKAKGLLAYFLTKPDNWQVRMEDLLKHGKDGLDAIKAGMKELRENGYATLETGRDKHGHLLGKEWVIHESPIAGKPLSRFTDSGVSRRSGKPDNRENPIIGKTPPLLNTEGVVNTDVVVNTETTSAGENPDAQNQKKEKNTPPIPGAPPVVPVLFSESEWSGNPAGFSAEVLKSFPSVDAAYYFNRCRTWSRNKSAKSPDWIQQAADLIESDRLRGELRILQPSQPSSHDNTANNPTLGQPGTKPFLDQRNIAERAARVAERLGGRQNRR